MQLHHLLKLKTLVAGRPPKYQVFVSYHILSSILSAARRTSIADFRQQWARSLLKLQTWQVSIELQYLLFYQIAAIELQQLGISVYDQLKGYYNSTMNSRMMHHHGKSMTTYNFDTVFPKAFSMRGFAKTGVFVFNRNGIPEKSFCHPMLLTT